MNQGVPYSDTDGKGGATADDCGLYWCTGDSDGRYPVSTVQNQSLKISEYSKLGVYNKEDFNDDIYNELVEKYDI